MTAAELRALCVARIEASKLVGHGMEHAAGDALSRALDIHMHVRMPERSARAILAALDDAERVATERALALVEAQCEAQANAAYGVFEWGAYTDIRDWARQKRESAKGGE